MDRGDVAVVLLHDCETARIKERVITDTHDPPDFLQACPVQLDVHRLAGANAFDPVIVDPVISERARIPRWTLIDRHVRGSRDAVSGIRYPDRDPPGITDLEVPDLRAEVGAALQIRRRKSPFRIDLIVRRVHVMILVDLFLPRTASRRGHDYPAGRIVP